MEMHVSYSGGESIRDFWDRFYENELETPPASLFAEQIVENLSGSKSIKLLDYGCGNGRDSFFLSNYFDVLGVDLSEVVIKSNLEASVKRQSLAKFTVCDSQIKFREILSVFNPDIFYARFLLHAITTEQEDELFNSLSSGLKQGANVLIECRTINDPLMQYGTWISDFERFHGHYRRFIDPNALETKLSKHQFQIHDLQESVEFSPTTNDKPSLLRVWAKKTS